MSFLSSVDVDRNRRLKVGCAHSVYLPFMDVLTCFGFTSLCDGLLTALVWQFADRHNKATTATSAEVRQYRTQPHRLGEAAGRTGAKQC